MTQPQNELSTSTNDEKCVCKVLTRRFRLVDYTVKSITGNNIVVKMWAGKSQEGSGCGKKNCMNRKRVGMMEILDGTDNEEKNVLKVHADGNNVVEKVIETLDGTDNEEKNVLKVHADGNNVVEKVIETSTGKNDKISGTNEVLKVDLDKHVI
ncbi:hypothetical protein VCUG_01082 [Vavraia culicis subsp. floridensis]|uniref:Uncharacterized protein n=1 Tax=Vavraia culicis (isolate floridensis) TaxID=948595 RepID=L2GUU8_VAVCU|nr:uncharacterized protein VCUG_01082 [Vavraia culicis subsp. floridensis]ELA47431.1 hypothetical protein VCUG_01082 [Vavraia culicis subsp. floridensis]